jgi:hypothetical protein
MNYKKAVRVATAMKGDSIQEYSDLCGISIQAMYKRFKKREPLWSWIQHIADYADVPVEEVVKWGS